MGTKNKAKLYVTDLDGTLLTKDARLSDHSRGLMEEVLQDGMPLTVASARSLHTMSRILGDLPIELPVICLNGAYISDYQKKEHLAIHDIDTNIKHSLLDYLFQNDIGGYISTYFDRREQLYHYQVKNRDQLWYLENRKEARDERLLEAPHIDPFYEQTVMAFTLMDKLDTLQGIERDFTQEFGTSLNLNLTENLYLPGSWWLTVHDHRANKANGVQHLLDHLNLQPEELHVFGDELNDLAMFSLAGKAYATSNANPVVLKKADQVLGDNNDDSVARFLHEQWKNP